MRIPAHLQDVAQSAGLRSWVDSPKFPTALWFAAVDDAIAYLKKYQSHGEEDDPDPADIAIVLSKALTAEGSLLTRVLEKKVDISTDSKWREVTYAAAWSIMQRKELEAKNAAEKAAKKGKQ